MLPAAPSAVRPGGLTSCAFVRANTVARPTTRAVARSSFVAVRASLFVASTRHPAGPTRCTAALPTSVAVPPKPVAAAKSLPSPGRRQSCAALFRASEIVQMYPYRSHFRPSPLRLYARAPVCAVRATGDNSDK